jgi:thiamine-monophosphate kinase
MSRLSEDELIQAIRKLLSGQAPGVVVGPGDDAALVEMGDRLGVLSTDMLVEGVDFELGLTSPHDLGYKALAVNVSDLAAMAASPRFALVALGLPKDVEPSWVVELYGGLREAADEYALSIVGGDLSSASQIVLSVTVTGEVSNRGAVTRAGAGPGDRLCVTGALGAAAGGLTLARERPRDASTAWGRDLLLALNRPVARVGEGQTLAQFGATAMIDLSDGLSLDLARMCRESGVGARVVSASIPIHPALAELARALPGVEPLRLAMEGGEDFELLATLPEESVAPAAATLGERFGTRLTDLGEILQAGEGILLAGSDGRDRPLEPRGWDHFAG